MVHYVTADIEKVAVACINAEKKLDYTPIEMVSSLSVTLCFSRA